MAFGARAVAVLAVMGILVAGGAIVIEPAENGAGQNSAFPRLMTTRALGLAVAAYKRKL